MWFTGCVKSIQTRWRLPPVAKVKLSVEARCHLYWSYLPLPPGLICCVRTAQTSRRPFGWTRQPVWSGWRGVTPSTAVWALCAPCTTWGCATSHSHTPATHPGERQVHGNTHSLTAAIRMCPVVGPQNVSVFCYLRWENPANSLFEEQEAWNV